MVERGSRLEFNDPGEALRANAEMLEGSRCLVVLYTHNVPSSLLVEIGMMIAKFRPIVILHSAHVPLPFLLQRAFQVFPTIRIRLCRTDGEFAEAAVAEVVRLLGQNTPPRDTNDGPRRAA
jgi:hypothetical protein